MAGLSEFDVVWVSERERFGRQANCAPLSVAGLLRSLIFDEHPVVLTSATLRVGGDFAAVAASVGLEGKDPAPWRGIDVGSPFDYRRQGILYVAKHLPPPHRDGIGTEVLAEIAELVWAAGGRTLGLFASQRAAETAAVHCRINIPGRTILCQGDAHLAELTKAFIADDEASLFGTLSLWQGIDVPGDTCRLVHHRQDPVPASRRPADAGAATRRRRVRRKWLHGGRSHPRRTAAGAGLRTPDPHARPTAGWSPCWIRASSPPATGTTCGPRCRTSG